MKITVDLDGGLLQGYEEVARITGKAPASAAKKALSDWLADNLPKLKNEASARDRLGGLIGCRVMRPVVLGGRNQRGAPRKRRWERGEIVYLEPELARKHALAEHVEILPPPEEGVSDG
jgi:hypothetical protein